MADRGADLGLAAKVAIVTGGGAAGEGIGSGRAAAILQTVIGVTLLLNASLRSLQFAVSVCTDIGAGLTRIKSL